MARRDLARRIEDMWATLQREFNYVLDQVMYRVRDHEFSQDKWELLLEALRNKDYSSAVFQEWLQLAEGNYPNVPWRRVLHLDGGDEDQSG